MKDAQGGRFNGTADVDEVGSFGEVKMLGEGVGDGDVGGTIDDQSHGGFFRVFENEDCGFEEVRISELFGGENHGSFKRLAHQSVALRKKIGMDCWLYCNAGLRERQGLDVERNDGIKVWATAQHLG